MYLEIYLFIITVEYFHKPNDAYLFSCKVIQEHFSVHFLIIFTRAPCYNCIVEIDFFTLNYNGKFLSMKKLQIFKNDRSHHKHFKYRIRYK